LSVEKIVFFIEELSLTQLDCKRALNPKILLETKIIKMLNSSESYDVEALVKRIEILENSIKMSIVTTRVHAEPEKIPRKHKSVAETTSGDVYHEEVHKVENQTLENKDDDAIFNAIISGWQSILKKVRSENAGLQAIIRESKLVEVKNKKLYLNLILSLRFI